VSASELSFELPGGGRVLFTERSHGNMSSVTGDGSKQAHVSREHLRARIGVRHLVRGHQVHGAVVRTVAEGDLARGDLEDARSSEPAGRSKAAGGARAPAATPRTRGARVAPTVDADGHATSLRGVGAMVLTADCLPVALARSQHRANGAEGCEQGAVAMLHAGWRGLLAGVLEEGVRAVGALGRGGDVFAIVGPRAGACCYEVGEEVHAAFTGAHRDGRRIDLGAIARDRLLAAGVAEVQVLEACTICDARFFSHRREGARAGRQAGVAWLT